MKKVVCFGLCFLIVLSSFVLCFAYGESPVVVPVAASSSVGSGITFKLVNGSDITYRSNNLGYLAYYYDGSSYRVLFFSSEPNTVFTSDYNGVTSNSYLNSFYNGFYYSSNVGNYSESYFLGEFSSAQDVIDYVNDTVFSTTLDLTYLIDGSISWLSSMAQAVKSNGLLLFFVLTVFVGVGIGLFNRFRRN